MGPKLRLPPAHRREHGERGDLAVAYGQAGAAVDVAVGELDHIAPDVTQGRHELPDVDTVDLAHSFQTALVTRGCRSVCHLDLLCLSSNEWKSVAGEAEVVRGPLVGPG